MTMECCGKQLHSPLGSRNSSSIFRMIRLREPQSLFSLNRQAPPDQDAANCPVGCRSVAPDAFDGAYYPLGGGRCTNKDDWLDQSFDLVQDRTWEA